jgi:prevent-host-death family protein
MKTLGISEFKTHALKILNQIAKTQEIIVITKRGKPFAQISPYRSSKINPEPGKYSTTLVFEKDLISSLGENTKNVF